MHDIHILTHYPISDEDVVRLNILRATLNHEHEALTHATIETTTESGDNIIFVARAKRLIVGMITLERSSMHAPRRTGAIRSFIVDIQYRSLGIGTQLLTRAVSVADQSGVEALSLRVQTDSTHVRMLYRKVGFCMDPRSITEFRRARYKIQPG